MTIEEEFFEAFGIEEVRECELRDECFLGFAHTCDKCDIYGQAYEVYPPITSDIVLELENILRKNGGFWLDVTTNTECWQYSSKRPKKSGLWFDNKKDALLNICIQLKDNNNIKQDVRNLFK